MGKAGKEKNIDLMFQELDAVIQALEKEDVSLEESFDLYAKGMEGIKECNKRLEAIEKKVKLLSDNGEVHEF